MVTIVLPFVGPVRLFAEIVKGERENSKNRPRLLSFLFYRISKVLRGGREFLMMLMIYAPFLRLLITHLF